MHTTPRLSLRLPDGTGDAPDVPLWLDRLASDVEGSFQVGLLSGRPAPGKAGRRYFATDARVEYVDTGATWEWAGRPAPGESTAPTVVTSLPGSPIDGQEVYYASAAFDGLVHLRYRVASPNAHKWDVIGTAPAKLLTSSGGSVPIGGWQDIPGVSVTAPLAGVYAVEFGFHGRMAPSPFYEFNFHVGVAPGPDADEINPSWTSPFNSVQSRAIERTVTAGTAVKLQYYIYSGVSWTGEIWHIWMRVTPRRVS